MKGPGIYKIRNIVNNKLYIGSSCRMQKRKTEHLYDLRRNKHHSPKLQNAWNKYGENNFVFEVIEEVEKNLIIREQFWIDTLTPDYNILTICCNSRKGVKRTQATAQKLEKYRILQRKEVIKICPKTFLILKTYNSINEASFGENIKISNIIKCCKKQGYFRTVGNYVWRYKDDYNILEIAQSVAYKKVIRKKSKQLEQHSFETNKIIKVWSSTKEASLSLNILVEAINNCITGRSMSAGGFKWKYKLIKLTE